MDQTAKPRFGKPVLVYVPCYNCAPFVEDTLRGIPEGFHGISHCLVIENCSTDNTSQTVLDLIHRKTFPFDITLIKTRENLGYAGSQKLAYSLASSCSEVKHVIMLHGDGQYPPQLTTGFLPYLNDDFGLVSGYRSKKHFPGQEETPRHVYWIIKTLSWIESLITGVSAKEWHSGFVMYSTEFLKQVPFERVTDTRHIDGHMILWADQLEVKTTAIPIYKRYKDHQAFTGLGTVKYVFDVFATILKFTFSRRSAKPAAATAVPPVADYDILATADQS